MRQARLKARAMNVPSQASDILREAMRRPASERADFIRTACGTDTELQHLLQSLIDISHLDASTDPDAPTAAMGAAGVAGAAAVPAPRRLAHASSDLTGQHVGPYELLRRIGKGGMGTVYAARRADHEYRKVVAVKLVKPGMETEEILRRFKHERQVLAGLDHPNIARLLDGGTDHGIPYLVMEYVEGTAIDVYCRTHNLSLTERLQLFLTVCSAVQYAHQSLVVHRDLKPANIIVSTDGVPKLLDFGIAKVLRPEAAEQPMMTVASELPMTPDYASPEQVRGEPVSTATDVYALGLLMYELLTGVHPLRAAARIVGFQKAVLETEPRRPSDMLPQSPDRKQLAARLRGDLDCIALMCLRKEPNRRYASVQHLIDDVHRHLDGKPVRAHTDSARYRVNKFVHRHKAGVLATAVVAGALVVSSIVSWIYYSKASFERTRAEARFQDVRQLAAWVLFDFDHVITAGTTPARAALIGKATEYLGRLERDRGSDPSIEQELVRGYLKVGDLSGNLYGPNLGDRAAARRSYERALAILGQARGKTDRALEAQVRTRLADLVAQDVGPGQAAPLYEKARDLLQREMDAGSAEARQVMTELLPRLAFAQSEAGMTERALESYAQSLRVVRDALQALPPGSDTSALRRQEARCELRLGEARATLGQTDDGLREMMHAVNAYQELAAAAPQSATAQRPLATASGLMGDVLAHAGRHPEAAEAYRKSLRVAEGLAAGDPQNAQYQRDVLTYLARLGEALGKSNRAAEGRTLTRRVLDLLRPRVSGPDATEFDLHLYAWTLLTTPFAELHNGAEALRAAERAVANTKRKDPARLSLLALALAETGNRERARETANEALASLPPGARSPLRQELNSLVQGVR